MANFDLNNYETVEERHARALEQYPDLRCVMQNHTTAADRAQGLWIVEARVYLSAEDQAADLPKAVDWAFEQDGVGMANKTSALENACTSSLGRAIRWALGGSKGPSREEMQKVARGVTPVKAAQPIPEGFTALVTGSRTLEQLKAHWETAVAGGFHEQVKQIVDNRKKVLQNG
jgi:hypothetical protein